MKVPGGSKTLITVVEIAAGAGLAAYAVQKFGKPRIGPVRTEVAIGLGLGVLSMFDTSGYGRDLLMLAAGAASSAAAAEGAKLGGATMIAGVPQIQGLPYAVGELPNGAAFLNYPRGAGQWSQLAREGGFR